MTDLLEQGDMRKVFMEIVSKFLLMFTMEISNQPRGGVRRKAFPKKLIQQLSSHIGDYNRQSLTSDKLLCSEVFYHGKVT